MTALLNTLMSRLTEGPSHQTPPADIRILVVDDEDTVLQYANRVLRAAGYRPVLASSGAEALERVEAMGGCDVLLTDLMMPAMTGAELACRMRRSAPDLKVLYLTGFSDRLFATKPTLWENEAYLDKPCSIGGLLEAVSLILYGSCVAPEEIATTAVPALWL